MSETVSPAIHFNRSR